MKLRSILLSACFMLSSMSLFAQYSPTESWPYLYENFQKGTLQARGVEIAVGEFNVPINGEKLHYVQDGKIMEVPAMKVLYVHVGEDLFIAAPDKLMKVVASNDNGYILNYSQVDMEKLNKVDIGYGIQSSSSSAQKVRMSSLSDIGVDLSTQNYIEPGSKEKKNGKVLPLKTTTYLYIGNTLIEASKADVVRDSGVAKKEMNAFIKDKKIKFRDNASLLQLIDFIAEEREK